MVIESPGFVPTIGSDLGRREEGTKVEWLHSSPSFVFIKERWLIPSGLEFFGL
jgi:hypothetical protein